MIAPRLLDEVMLTRFEATLRGLGVPVDDLEPGLTDDAIDALTMPEDLHLPDEVRAWWRWHNGPPQGRSVSSELLPTRAMLSLREALGLKVWLPPDQVFGLLPITGPPHYGVQCSQSGPVAAKVYMKLDWAMPIERVVDSFGELVWTWICHLERGLWVPDPKGGWADEQPVWEEGFPDDVESRGIW